MPYLKPERRLALDLRAQYALKDFTLEAGDLNYLVTRLALAYLGDAPRYTDFNAAVGALECAKQELYRRMVAPYENSKALENGDVYPDAVSADFPPPQPRDDGSCGCARCTINRG